MVYSYPTCLGRKKIWSFQCRNVLVCFILICKGKNIMKKYDKEYSTQYSPEKDYLLKNGIKPTFVKVVEGVTIYKYTKTAELFKLLSFFYE